MRKLLSALVVLGLFGLGVFWFVTRPTFEDPSVYAELAGSATAGERIFNATGCAACHAAPGAEGDARLVLAGGRAFVSDFGTFYAPNISQSATNGIGDWTLENLATALRHGVSPDGRHYFPAFPYTSYAKMRPGDIADLYAYLKSLPATETPSRAHDVGFPFNIRRSLGGWKLLFFSRDWVVDGALTDQQTLGRYIVEAMGHCAECHTPRNALGGWKRSRWLTGGPNPDGKGTIPNVTPHETGIGSWSTLDIVTYLNSGFTPEFDVAGGTMADVVANTMKLPPEDLEAIAAYLQMLEPLEETRP